MYVYIYVCIYIYICMYIYKYILYNQPTLVLRPGYPFEKLLRVSPGPPRAVPAASAAPRAPWCTADLRGIAAASDLVQPWNPVEPRVP